ncbi:sugar transferase [Marinoscillum pacificum]|uniref:sugar transferase n=1 Tax=Marinoscillum pacificum TaxID=392723 RepID=UPI0021583E39|nr:sugar transferase [Marinoscillum pacificum]
MQDNSKYLKIWKPLIDRMTAMMLFVVLFPVMICIAVLLKITGSPVIFKHSRPGYNEQIFELYKFTSMKNGEITRVGSILRKSSLDEIPQLINIIKGEMSFVGPRPLLQDYLSDYSDEGRKRHLVKPGVTGLAQVNGRNALTLEEKVELDLEYVQNVSFLFDLKILFKTAVRIFYFHQADYHSFELHQH